MAREQGPRGPEAPEVEKDHQSALALPSNGSHHNSRHGRIRRVAMHDPSNEHTHERTCAGLTRPEKEHHTMRRPVP